MRVYLAARGVYGFADFPGGWPGLAELGRLAVAMAETTRQCPVCPDVPARAFVLALAEVAPLEVAADLARLAGEWP